MSKKSKKKRRQVPAPNGHVQSETLGEDRRSVAVTVAWMMSTLATAASLTLAAVAYVLIRSMTIDAGQSSPLAVLPRVSLFIALITGTLTLILIPVVYRVRNVSPPSLVTIGSVCIATIPWVLNLVWLWR